MKKVFTTVLASLFLTALLGVSAFAQAEKPKNGILSRLKFDDETRVGP